MAAARKIRRAVAVVRVSRRNGREGESFRSPGEQAADMEALADRLGVRIVATFEDINYSGATMDRPGMDAAREMIRTGQADAILVAKVDRFSRDVEQGLAVLREIHEQGGSLLCGDMDADSREPNGEMIFTLLLTVARNEWRRRQAGFARVTEELTKEGKRIQPPPTGYLRTKSRLVPDPATEKLIPELFARRATGQTWDAIRSWWHEQTGVWLHPTAFGRMIRNRTYLGELSNGSVVSEVRHPALVSDELFREANAANAPRRARSKRPTTLLAGVLRCASCGKPMTTTVQKVRGKAYPVYRCQVRLRDVNCPAPVTISAVGLDALVLEQFHAGADHVSASTVGPDRREFERADAAVAAMEAEYEGFIDAFAGADPKRTAAKVEWYEAEIARLVGEREALHERKAVAAARHRIGDEFDGLPVEAKRRLLAAVLDHVVVSPAARTAKGGPARVPLADRVRIIWRDDEA